MNSQLLGAVRDYAEAHADRSGIVRTPIRGLSLIRAGTRGDMVPSLPRPLVCLVVQGAKTIAVGAEGSTLSAGASALLRDQSETSNRVTDAGASRPYLAMALELDIGVIAELSSEVGLRPPVRGDVSARSRFADAEVSATALRLVRLLDQPDSLPVLSAQTLREMHYWLLMGRHGNALRELWAQDRGRRQVMRAVALLRAEFSRRVTIKRLADTAGMSVSTLHRSFKAVTSFSPLQFQKRLRLHEARTLMLSGDTSVTMAAYSVGYQSVSQFSRDYRRVFGVPPTADIEAHRRTSN